MNSALFWGFVAIKEHECGSVLSAWGRKYGPVGVLVNGYAGGTLFMLAAMGCDALRCGGLYSLLFTTKGH